MPFSSLLLSAGLAQFALAPAYELTLPVMTLRRPAILAAPAMPPAPVTADGPQWAPPVVHTLVMFTAVRLVEAHIWPDPFAETDPSVWGSHYREAFTKPPLFDPSKPAFSWDGDRWQINVIGHALMGSEMYMRARTCHFGWAGALAFTAGGTLVWEYGFEANGVRPSGQDLLFTPLSGLALGEARYQLWRLAGDIDVRAWRVAIRALLDPFGELERGVGLFSY